MRVLLGFLLEKRRAAEEAPAAGAGGRVRALSHDVAYLLVIF
jgi:hypothetical protein